MELIFATNNNNKMSEIQKVISGNHTIVSLQDIGCYVDIPETGNTLEANALQKARFIYDTYKKSCFADDTGLVVEALNGNPGVFSARYAGEDKNADKNMAKVLEELSGETNRKACFKTTMALILNGEEYLFSGQVDGTIIDDKIGTKGFGYDPIFLPDGFDKTFAEMDIEVKNRISHRGRAITKLMTFLSNL